MSDQSLGTTKGIVLYFTLFVDTAKVDEFLTRFRKLYEKATAEPECVSFQVSRRTTAEEPEVTVFQLTEVWDATREWITDVQLKREYFKELFPPLEELFVKPRIVAVADHLPLWAHPL
ncbi:hypothetical protein AX16_010735 [Volvariella volvacea WC 439]|nr:hypothetical protein AX16_010735 [Volvariella volvacea WC 439]